MSKPLIVVEITNDNAKKRFDYPAVFFPYPGEKIIDSNGEEWTFDRVDVPKKDDMAQEEAIVPLEQRYADVQRDHPPICYRTIQLLFNNTLCVFRLIH